MALTEQTIYIRIKDPSIEPRLYMVQYDTGRSIRCVIQDWEIPSGASAKVYVRKISGKVVYNFCTVDEDTNSVIIDVTNQMIAEAGADNLAMVEITSGDECVTTFAFFLVVKYKFGDGEESTNESTWVDELMQKYIDEAEALLKDAGNALERADELAEEAKGLAEEAIQIATEAGEEAKQTANDAAEEAKAAAETANEAAEEAKKIASEAAEEAKQTADEAAEKAYEAAALANAASNGNDEVFKMLMTQTTFGNWITEDGKLIVTEDEESIEVSYPFCNCDNVRTVLEDTISSLEEKINNIYATLETVLATE